MRDRLRAVERPKEIIDQIARRLEIASILAARSYHSLMN